MKNNEKIMLNSMKSLDNKCPECHGNGMVTVWESSEWSQYVYGDDRKTCVARPCPRCNGGHAERVQAVRESANIPNSFYDSKMADFDWDIYTNMDGTKMNVEKQRQIVEAFVNQFELWEKRGIGLYIYSKTRGSGKTFLASCICNELIAKYPMTTRFVSASKLIDIQKNEGHKYGFDPIDTLCNCKLLVLDDLGQKMTGAEWLGDILFRITDERSQKGLVTIVTSNIQIHDLQIDDRVPDRLNKMCSPIPLPEFCVRAKESRANQVELFQELGLIGGKKVV